MSVTQNSKRLFSKHLSSNTFTDRTFVVKMQDAISDTFKIKVEALQENVSRPILYILYTANIPINSQTNLTTFANVTAILATRENPIRESAFLQNVLHKIEHYLKKIKFNEDKSKD